MSIQASVNSMDAPRYTVSQAAGMIGKSADTLRRWDRDGKLTPSDSKQFGKTVIRLYTPDDIEKGREIARTLRPGRKRGHESVGGRHGDSRTADSARTGEQPRATEDGGAGTREG